MSNFVLPKESAHFVLQNLTFFEFFQPRSLHGKQWRTKKTSFIMSMSISNERNFFVMTSDRNTLENNKIPMKTKTKLFD